MEASLHIGGGGIFACGESLSLRQAWVEGALESAQALWRLEALQKRLHK
jgi:monoamine oxidase